MWLRRLILAGLAMGMALAGCVREESMGRVELLAGPMPGWSGHREVEIWAMVGHRDKPLLQYRAVKEGKAFLKVAPVSEEPGGVGKVVRFRPSLLEPGTVYEGRLAGRSEMVRFQTQADWPYKTDPPGFSFITGSCLYLNDLKFDRPGKPYGQGEGILNHMAQSGADFMLWLGDNTYLRPADWTSPAGIRDRYEKEKCAPELQEFWRAMHHLATWDDHDFGPNDASKSFALGSVARAEFRRHWANPPSGLPEEAGVMSALVWSDCLFVLLDNRTQRDANDLDPRWRAGKTQLGEQQLDWLEQTLLEHRRAPFKFVVLGGQFLKDHRYESFRDYPADRERILNFLETHKIEGVVFLSGDRHFTELLRLERKGGYPLYELTSSPIGSGVATRAAEEEKGDPLTVPGTMVLTQNFCRVEVRGPRLARVMVMQAVDKNGVVQWEREIAAAELRVPQGRDLRGGAE